MGRYYWDKKDTVEDCKTVSISFLKKNGYLSEPCCKSGAIYWTNTMGERTGSIDIAVSTLDKVGYIRFKYTVTDRRTQEKRDYDYKIALTTTPCNFGGARYWFVCMLKKNGGYCGRRVGKLYLAPGANYFGCRHCYNLSYQSRNECRLGRFGQLGYILKAERQYEELYNSIKRWTWRGKPTKKVKKLHILKQKMNRAVSLSKTLGHYRLD